MLRFAARRLPSWSKAYQQTASITIFKTTTLTSSLSSGKQDTLPIIEDFSRRHIGPNDGEVEAMLKVVGAESLDELSRMAIPANILDDSPLKVNPPTSELELARRVTKLAKMNKTFRNYIGMGYYDSKVPPPIVRNILENPGW